MASRHRSAEACRCCAALNHRSRLRRCSVHDRKPCQHARQRRLLLNARVRRSFAGNALEPDFHFGSPQASVTLFHAPVRYALAGSAKPREIHVNQIRVRVRVPAWVVTYQLGANAAPVARERRIGTKRFEPLNRVTGFKDVPKAFTHRVLCLLAGASCNQQAREDRCFSHNASIAGRRI